MKNPTLFIIHNKRSYSLESNKLFILCLFCFIGSDLNYSNFWDSNKASEIWNPRFLHKTFYFSPQVYRSIQKKKKKKSFAQKKAVPRTLTTPWKRIGQRPLRNYITAKEYCIDGFKEIVMKPVLDFSIPVSLCS